jgi:two-component system, cell cycle sensor histidine kinase and response regulator CckA
MGGRVTHTGSGDLARAKRLKKALASGSPPAFVVPATVPPAVSPTNTCANSALSWRNKNGNETRSRYLERVFQGLQDALSIVDSGGRVICVNDAFARMFGFGTRRVLGHSLNALLMPPDREAESRWISECLARGEAITLETERLRKDRQSLEVSLSSIPLGDGSVCTVYRDISARKWAEKMSLALYRVAERSSTARDLQQFYAAVHEIVDQLMYAKNFAIALVDPATELLSFPYFVNEQEKPPAPGKLGQGLTEYVLRTGESLLADGGCLQQLAKRGVVELNGIRAAEWMGVPLKVGNHAFGALVLQNYSKQSRFSERDKDILSFVSQQVASAIENKRTEQALRRSEARYRSLVQSSVYGIYRSSLEGKFLDVNPALVAMLGYDSAEEVLALDPQKDVFVNAPEQARLMDEFRRTGRMDGIEVKWKRKNGSAVTVRISGRAVSSADEPADVLEAIAEDVTERRVLEDQFRQAQKMEAVGRLAGGIAHDFNNLLMVISGYTEVALGQMGEEDPLRSKVHAIQLASDRATMLTRQLLAFSRKQMLELKVIDVNAIVQDMERLLRPLIGERIELSTKLAADAGRTRADAGQLEQVLMNLVVNSKDAMPQGGKIEIETRSVTLDDTHRGEQTFIRTGSYVVVSVIDNGMGMDKETQSRIFEPFFTTKEKGKGTGLGLSTVYGIVKQSGGYILVQSELQHGTTFHIYLPRVEEELESKGPTPAARSADTGTETVLLVEDEESVRQLVRETLEAKGYRVLEAENGEAALHAVASQSGPIHLLITDVVMPNMGGHELAERLLEERPTMKVIYLSGYTEEALVEGKIDGKAFLQKPFTLQTLSRKVREVLG